MRTIAYWLSLAMIFTVPWATFVVLPGVGTLSRFMGLVAAAFWLATVLVTGRLRKLGPFMVLIFMFILWNIAAGIWSVDPDRALTRNFTYVQIGLLTLIIWDLYTTSTTIKAGLQAYVLGLAIPAGSTIASYIASAQTEFATYGRYSSTGSDTNTTAILLATGIPLAWYLAASVGKGRFSGLQRIVNYIYIPIISFAMVLTATRFALIMTFPAFIFGISTLGQLRLGYRILIFIFIATALLTLGSRIPQANLQRLGTIDDEISGGDLNDRTELWGHGINFWLEQPIIGIGTGGYDKSVEPFYGRSRAVHNSFIAVLAELGIVGIVIFGAILANTLYFAWRLPNSLEKWFWFTVLLSWTLGNMALTWIYSKPTWILFTLLAASASLVIKSREVGRHQEAAKRYDPALSQISSR